MRSDEPCRDLIQDIGVPQFPISSPEPQASEHSRHVPALGHKRPDSSLDLPALGALAHLRLSMRRQGLREQFHYVASGRQAVPVQTFQSRGVSGIAARRGRCAVEVCSLRVSFWEGLL